MPDESPYASIRELGAMERRILEGQDAMKHELLEAIRCSDEAHDKTHVAMRAYGDDRHRRIDDLLGKDALEDARRTGMMTAGVWTIRTLRTVNEFRWLILAAIAAALLFLNNASLTMSVH